MILLEFKPPKNATLFDIVLNTYGTLDLLSKFMLDNNINDVNTMATGLETFTFDYSLVNNYGQYDTISIKEMQFTTGDSVLSAFFEQPNNILTEAEEVLLNEDSDDFIIE